MNYHKADFNHDSIVDASDYAIWATSFGSTVDLAADGNSSGVIDAADYTIWRDSMESAHVTAIPEPDTFFLVIVLVMLTTCIPLHVLPLCYIDR